MLYNKGLFASWVPKSLQLVLIAVMLLPLLGVSPIYSATLMDMFSSLGTLSESLSFAINASTIGMMLAMSFAFKFKARFSAKQILVSSYILLAVCSFLISCSDNMVWNCFLSFLMGFIKLIGMIELVLPVMFIISPTGDRGRFYSFFYPLSICLGQLTSFFASKLDYNYNWQEVYDAAVILLLFCTLLAIVFMHNKRGSGKQAFGTVDWISILLITSCLMLLNYVLVYAKQQSWFASSNIILSSLGFFILGTLFIIRQLVLKIPYMDVRVFKKRSVISSLVFIGLMGLFLGTSSIQSTFTSLLKYDSPTNAKLNLAMIPGVVIGGILSFYWFKKNWSMKSMLFIAFSFFLANTVMMYFLISPVIEINDLILPQVLKGAGMCLVYIGGSFYFASMLTTPQMMSTIGIAVCVRSFIGTAFFGAIISWAAYALQLDSMSNIAGAMDATNFVVNGRGNGQQLFSVLQVQGMLSSIKSIFGYVSLSGVLILFYVVLHPFERMHHRKMIIFRKKFRGEVLEGYRTPIGKSGELAEIGAVTIIS